MKVYLADNYASRDYLREKVVPRFLAAGHEVTSRWLTNTPNDDWQTASVEDADDVFQADVLVLFVDQTGLPPGRGKYFELGLAFGLHKRIILVGTSNNCIFFALPGMEKFDTIEAALEALAGSVS